MKKRLIIHIGMHKTGSSSLQRFLSRNRIVLRALGIEYPRSVGADGKRQSKHNALFSAISHESDFGTAHQAFGPSASLIEALADQIETNRCRTTILSAEGFSGPRPDFARAFAPLAERFDVQIIVFLRRYDLWIESFYKQMVLSREVRETRSFRDFLLSDSIQTHLRYAGILGWWADAFGDSAIRIVPFEPALGGPSPVEAFLSAARLSRNLMWLPHAKAHVNRGPSAELVEVVRLANVSGADIDRQKLPLIESQIGESSPAYFTLSERTELIHRLRSDANTIAARHNYGRTATLFMQHEQVGDSRPTSWMERGCPIDAATLLPIFG